jgi:hypothetical protein
VSDAAMRHHFDRKTPLEELRLVEVVDVRLLGGQRTAAWKARYSSLVKGQLR